MDHTTYVIYTDPEDNLHVHSLTEEGETHQHYDSKNELTDYSSTSEKDPIDFANFVESQASVYGVTVSAVIISDTTH